MRKDKNKQEIEQEQARPRKERLEVSVPLHHKNFVSTLDFDWPEFTNERVRIKEYTKRFADVTIEEAFGREKLETTIVPDIPMTFVLGSTIKAKLTKHGDNVSLTGISSKETIICRNNLKRYKNMQMTEQDIDAKVVAIDKARQTVTVDVLQPIFEKWIDAIMKDKTIQYGIKNPMISEVKNLQLRNGGFIGKTEVPNLSEFVGEPYLVDAFIPGSQIVLNIENDFEKWNGETVKTFVAGYTNRPGSVGQMSLICSRKSYLNYLGNINKIEFYKAYCLQGKAWESISKNQFVGTITGIINKSKKCGVFVEIPILNITGMINTTPDKLVEYKAGENIMVCISDFEQMVGYDPTTGNSVHLEPYKIENDCVKSCILKPVLTIPEKKMKRK